MDGIPHCIHGNIVLGCPDDLCPTQLAYLDQQNAALKDYYRRQREAVRGMLGI